MFTFGDVCSGTGTSGLDWELLELATAFRKFSRLLAISWGEACFGVSVKTISLVIEGFWTVWLVRPEMLCANPMVASGTDPGWSKDGDGIVTVERVNRTWANNHIDSIE